MPTLAVLMAGLLLMASSCQSDPSILEQALDPGTAVPSEGPSPAPLETPSAKASPSATVVPTPKLTEVPAPIEATKPAPPIEVPEPTKAAVLTRGPRETVHSLSMPEEFLSGDSRLEGDPFAAMGAVPAAIIASTEECDIVSVDSQTGAVRVLADFSAYSGNASVFSSCSDQGIEYQVYTGTAEIAPGFIEDVEWVDPKYVLIGNCCEPAVGRFEVLDIEEHDQPYWLALNGSYPAANSKGELTFIGPALSGGLASFGIVSLDLNNDDDSDPSHPFFGTSGDVAYHHLTLGEDGNPHPNSFASRTTWVGGDDIALGVWTVLDDQGFFPWVVLIDLDTGSVASNARGSGWMLPTGDDLGNLVVAEQHCFLFPKSECIGSPAKVVVVDSETLAPLYEVEVDDVVVDMDLERGWLLVTLVDGRMGVLDLPDGKFNVLADGIRNAVWQE